MSEEFVDERLIIREATMIKVQTVYEVYETTNEMGARGGKVGTFTDWSEANRRAEGKGWYGGKGAVTPVSALVINGMGWILKHNEPIIMDVDIMARDRQDKEAALAKLSDREKKLLGIETKE